MVTAENFPWEADAKNLEMAVPGLLGSGGLAFRGCDFERNVRNPTYDARLVFVICASRLEFARGFFIAMIDFP